MFKCAKGVDYVVGDGVWLRGNVVDSFVKKYSLFLRPVYFVATTHSFSSTSSSSSTQVVLYQISLLLECLSPFSTQPITNIVFRKDT